MNSNEIAQLCTVEVRGISSILGIKSIRDQIQQKVEEFSFCVIRGVATEQEIEAELLKLRKKFNPKNDIYRSGRVKQKMADFQRFDCGDYSQVNARVGRTLTRFFWNGATEFQDMFLRMKQIRDFLLQRDIEDLSAGEFLFQESHYHHLPKILHYPAGGGFLNEHYDGYNNDGFFNIGMSVTLRGRDFKEGGVYYLTKEGEEFDIEEYLRPGDIYLHSEEAPHGVHAIDKGNPLDIETLSGRISLILSAEKFISE